MAAGENIRFFVALLLLVASSATAHGADKPGAPKNYFCYTTAGGAAETGGNIVPGRCGEACDARTDSSQWVGWIGVFVAILCFGSNYVPVKKFDSGDGIFFQWILCVGIWTVGLVVNMIRGQPPFFFSSLIAGIFWSLGNVLVVPIVKTVGLAVGLTLWSTASLITGWITGVIIFDQEVRCAPLNYAGIAMIIISVFILLFVRSEGKSEEGAHNSRIQSGQTVLLDQSIDTLLRGKLKEDIDHSWVDKLGMWPRRLLGVNLALFSGCIYGFQFVPIEYLKLCDDAEHSCEDLDYLFGYHTGILIGSTVILLVYSAYMNNAPQLYQRIVLPGFVAGVMWGVGSAGLFLGNKHLSLAVSIPFITSGSQFVSAAWGIIVFKEIKNWKYIVVYVVAVSITLVGLVMDGLSRCTVGCEFALHTPYNTSYV